MLTTMPVIEKKVRPKKVGWNADMEAPVVVASSLNQAM